MHLSESRGRLSAEVRLTRQMSRAPFDTMARDSRRVGSIWMLAGWINWTKMPSGSRIANGRNRAAGDLQVHTGYSLLYSCFNILNLEVADPDSKVIKHTASIWRTLQRQYTGPSSRHDHRPCAGLLLGSFLAPTSFS